jgi:protein-arginine kinase activator protein McsA
MICNECKKETPAHLLANTATQWKPWYMCPECAFNLSDMGKKRKQNSYIETQKGKQL